MRVETLLQMNLKMRRRMRARARDDDGRTSIMDALGAYGSESESEREAGDRDAGADDAFVGPARPPPRVVGKPPVDDEEDARRDDVAFLESMCGDEEDARVGTPPNVGITSTRVVLTC